MRQFSCAGLDGYVGGNRRPFFSLVTPP